ncbi:MAG: hypothetical protein NT069_09455 [Planctomycetota bacterium]|nr:hypothetical protein [Planctomycetota bacterium]
MHRNWSPVAAILLIAGVGACQSPSKPSSQVKYQRVPPSGKYTFVDVKRFQPNELAQVPKGARCTVETTNTNRSVTGYVQKSGPEGIVLVNAEEIVAKAEVPSNLNGKGYDHHAKDKVTLAVGEVASVRVFRE